MTFCDIINLDEAYLALEVEEQEVILAKRELESKKDSKREKSVIKNKKRDKKNKRFGNNVS